MPSVVPIIQGIIDLVNKNLIARTNVISNIISSNIVNVENSFHFNADQEAVLIDYGYNFDNYSSTSHYQQYEYVRIKEVIDTNTVLLYSNTVGQWYASDNTSLQKTIGHSPLYENHVYYGDREVIPTEEMALTVEPASSASEWIYIPGGLSSEFRVRIRVYGKDVNTNEGMIILNKYGDAVESLLNRTVHIDIDNYDTPILANVAANTNSVIIADNSDNRNYFKITGTECCQLYEIQDNNNTENCLAITNIEYGTPIVGQMTLTVYRRINNPTHNLVNGYNLNDFAVMRKHGRYIYDSRVDNVDYGTVQKGSAILRVCELSWFGKEVEEYIFPQPSLGVNYFPKI